MPTYQIVVVGGGPAGSSAAIHLVRRGLHVLLLEKEEMPRDKLCGGFLSTEVEEMCGSLGVLDAMRTAGVRRVLRLELTDPAGRSYRDALPGTGLSLSRRAFDHLLFERAGEVGADAAGGEAVVSVEGRLEDGFVVTTNRRRVAAAVVLGAYGRREPLDRRFDRSFLDRRSPFVGFNARYEGPAPDGSIELHTFDGGYCGLIEDERGAINVCWLTRAGDLKQAGGTPQAMVDHVLVANPRLGWRLAAMQRRTEFLAVGQLAFRAKDLFAADVCMIGDAAGMIAPLCGDGMGMAVRTAEIVAPLTDGFVRGEISAEAFRSRYRAAWTAEFAHRMRLGRWLHRALTTPSVSRIAVAMAGLAPPAARRVVAATRG